MLLWTTKERSERSQSNVVSSELSRRDFVALTGVGLAGATAASAYQAPKKLYAYMTRHRENDSAGRQDRSAQAGLREVRESLTDHREITGPRVS